MAPGDDVPIGRADCAAGPSGATSRARALGQIAPRCPIAIWFRTGFYRIRSNSLAMSIRSNAISIRFSPQVDDLAVNFFTFFGVRRRFFFCLRRGRGRDPA